MIFSLYGFGQQPVDKYNLDFEGTDSDKVWLCLLDNYRLAYHSIKKAKFEPSFTYKSMDDILFIRQITPATIKTFEYEKNTW